MGWTIAKWIRAGDRIDTTNGVRRVLSSRKRGSVREIVIENVSGNTAINFDEESNIYRVGVSAATERASRTR